jgi:two-component system, OmpR family, KDP operon response regulator KdpE
MATVLVVDDEPIVRDVVTRYLERDGHRALVAANGHDARTAIEREAPGLVVLDVMLPGEDGLSLCRWIRSSSDLPVILLTARGEEADRIVGLELGADDYVTKPFSLAEFVARVRAQLRRAWIAPYSLSSVVECDGLTIDLQRRELSREGEPIRLTRIEWRLLETLLVHAGRTLTHQQLFDAVWAKAYGHPQQYLRVHVTNLRRKIEREPASPRLIVTEPGVGYRFEREPP